jgi:F-type H+-transporting ATPase subunit c
MNEWIAVALAIGLPALGGALGQGRIGAAAMEGIARNPAATPRLMAPLLVSLALVESLAILGLLVSWQLLAKLDA